MRTFSKLATSFWTDELGRELRAGGPQLQVLALYLISNKHSNYTGIYSLPKMYIAADLGLDLSSVDTMLRRLDDLNYAKYDESAEVVWVTDAAREQLGESLKSGDKMVKAVQRELSALPKMCVLTAQFIERYADAYHLKPEADKPAQRRVEAPAQHEPQDVLDYDEPAESDRDAAWNFAWATLDIPDALDHFIALRNEREEQHTPLQLSDEQVVARVLRMRELRGYRTTINALRAAFESCDYDLHSIPDQDEAGYSDI